MEATPKIGKTLGQAISKRRRQLALSQQDLADRCGLCRSYISDVERGIRPNVCVLTLQSIANGLALEASQLVMLAELEMRRIAGGSCIGAPAKADTAVDAAADRA